MPKVKVGGKVKKFAYTKAGKKAAKAAAKKSGGMMMEEKEMKKRHGISRMHY